MEKHASYTGFQNPEFDRDLLTLLTDYPHPGLAKTRTHAFAGPRARPYSTDFEFNIFLR